jgi:RNA polymerase sigma-70 factor (ECF subfamily)
MDPLETATDAEVVARTLVDTSAFTLLVERYEEKLVRYIRRLGIRNAEDGEDVLQEIFIKVYKNLNAFDSSLSFSSWIYRIAHNEAISFYRKQTVRPEGHQLPDSTDVLTWLPEETTDSAERLFDSGVNATVVKNALSDLDPKYRDAIILRYFEHKEYDEISDILKIPIGSVGTLIHRGKKQLADLIPTEQVTI